MSPTVMFQNPPSIFYNLYYSSKNLNTISKNPFVRFILLIRLAKKYSSQTPRWMLISAYLTKISTQQGCWSEQ